MNLNPNPFAHSRKLALAGLLAALGGFAGCVDINDTKVQVQPPGEADIYGRNVLDKCTPHTSPHRLFTALTGTKEQRGLWFDALRLLTIRQNRLHDRV